MRIIRWWVDLYTLRILGATVMAVVWLYGRAARRHDLDTHTLGWWLLGLLACAILLGRAGYIVENWDYFVQNPEMALRLRRTPGLHGLGALLGGLLGAGAWATLARRRFWHLLARLTPAGLWIAAGAWWGCWDAGCAWGKVGAPGRLTVQAPDLYHTLAPRYPVQLLGMAWAGVTAGLGWALGDGAAWAMPVYLVAAAALTLLRGDPAVRVGGLRLDTLLHVVAALVLAGYGFIVRRRTPELAPVPQCSRMERVRLH
jgi:prolipoprotein diacylglyceryltransferase